MLGGVAGAGAGAEGGVAGAGAGAEGGMAGAGAGAEGPADWPGLVHAEVVHHLRGLRDGRAEFSCKFRV